jgi:hypothetical protein
VAIALVALQLQQDEQVPVPAPVDVEASGPRFTSLDDLAEASDLVVVGTIAAAGEGRVITDPADPEAGIRTVLLDVDVEQVITGRPPDRLVIEHEAALLDGTPITVGGVGPPPPGERGLYFLVAGGSDALPYHAFVGTQGRYSLADRGLAPVDGEDPVAVSIARMGLDGLARALAP